MRALNCLRCGAKMEYSRREKLQLGQTGFFLGDWPNLLAGALEVEIHGCKNCGKLEFYLPDFHEPDCDVPVMEPEELPPEVNQNIVSVSMEGVPQVRCPACGTRHDFDYPRCPKCGFQY